MTIKIFRWFDSCTPKEEHYGPYYTSHQEILKQALTHTEEELLKLPLSNTIKKRISSAREGTIIKIHYLHRNGNLCIQRL